MWSAVKGIVEGTSELRKIPPFEVADRIYLFPGDIRLSEFESELNTLWADCLQRKLRGFRGTSALSGLISTAVEDHKIDFVFYDSGPNIGPLTRIILLDCDYFVVPVGCDNFSVRALKTLGFTLSTWIDQWQLISGLAPKDVDVLPGRPKLLGYIPQGFKVYREQPVTVHGRYMRQIEKHLYSDVISVLQKKDPSLASGTPSRYKLGQVKNFGKLASTSQTEGVAFKDAVDSTPESASNAEKTFRHIAEQIIERTTLASSN